MADTFAVLASAQARYGSERPSKVSPATRSATAGVRVLEGLLDTATGRQRDLTLAQLRDYRQLVSESRVY